jgi:hypothetical protein
MCQGNEPFLISNGFAKKLVAIGMMMKTKELGCLIRLPWQAVQYNILHGDENLAAWHAPPDHIGINNPPPTVAECKRVSLMVN